MLSGLGVHRLVGRLVGLGERLRILGEKGAIGDADGRLGDVAE